jgi:hypothetical protein
VWKAEQLWANKAALSQILKYIKPTSRWSPHTLPSQGKLDAFCRVGLAQRAPGFSW